MTKSSGNEVSAFFKSLFKPLAQLFDKEESASEEANCMGNGCCKPPDQFPKQENVVPRQVSRVTPHSEKQTTQEGVAVRDVYRLSRTLGTGGFSVVKLAVARETEEEYACKVMSLPPPGCSNAAEVTREDIFKEINILISLDHPNIIYLKEYYEEGNKAYLIMEYLRGGELLDAVLDIGHYSEREARTIFKQIVSGVGYLHKRGIAHRDLKLENLLLAERGDITRVKIADFGLAKGGAQTSLSTICGTPQYVAPEVIAKGARSGFHSYDVSCDVWSCGVILFVLLGGYPPFYDESEPRLFDKIRRGYFTFDDPVWKQISDDAKNLIKRMLTVDPKKRPTCTEVLNDPWVKEESGLPPRNEQLLATKSRMRSSMRRRPGMSATVTPVDELRADRAEEQAIIDQLAEEERRERQG